MKIGITEKGDASISKSGQRSAYSCLNNKFELLDTSQQCAHKCVYCYWKKEEKEGLF